MGQNAGMRRPPLRILDLSGGPEAMGHAHGAAYADEIQAYAEERVRLAGSEFWAGGRLDRTDVLDIARSCLPAHEAHSAQLYAELCGIADGAGITPEEAVVVGGFTDFVDTVRAVVGGDHPLEVQEDDCTAFIVPDARADGRGFYGQTWDMHDTATEHVVLLRLHPDDGPAALVFTTTGCVGQIGYMKVYDPAFEIVEREVRALENIRYIQVNHLHTSNDHHLRHFRIARGDPPLAPPVVEPHRPARTSSAAAALNVRVPPEVETAYRILSGSLIHDLYGLRHLFGDPARVVSTELWNGGFGITTIFEYSSGARCVVSWVELPGIRAFKETLEISADERRLNLSYPTGFARGILSEVKIEGIDGEGRPFEQKPYIEWESAFARELRHFHSCIVDGAPCRTPIEDGRRDVALIGDICRRYLELR